MSLAHAIKQTMQAHNLSTAQVATHVGMEQDRAAFYHMLNGVTTEPRLATFIQLCITLGTTPSELLELAEVWRLTIIGTVSYVKPPRVRLGVTLAACGPGFATYPN